MSSGKRDWWHGCRAHYTWYGPHAAASLQWQSVSTKSNKRVIFSLRLCNSHSWCGRSARWAWKVHVRIRLVHLECYVSLAVVLNAAQSRCSCRTAMHFPGHPWEQGEIVPCEMKLGKVQRRGRVGCGWVGIGDVCSTQIDHFNPKSFKCNNDAGCAAYQHQYILFLRIAFFSSLPALRSRCGLRLNAAHQGFQPTIC